MGIVQTLVQNGLIPYHWGCCAAKCAKVLNSNDCVFSGLKDLLPKWPTCKLSLNCNQSILGLYTVSVAVWYLMSEKKEPTVYRQERSSTSFGKTDEKVYFSKKKDTKSGDEKTSHGKKDRDSGYLRKSYEKIAIGIPSFRKPKLESKAVGTSSIQLESKAVGTPSIQRESKATGTPSIQQESKATGTPSIQQESKATGTPSIQQESKATGTPSIQRENKAVGSSVLNLESKAVDTHPPKQESKAVGINDEEKRSDFENLGKENIRQREKKSQENTIKREKPKEDTRKREEKPYSPPPSYDPIRKPSKETDSQSMFSVSPSSACCMCNDHECEDSSKDDCCGSEESVADHRRKKRGSDSDCPRCGNCNHILEKRLSNAPESVPEKEDESLTETQQAILRLAMGDSDLEVLSSETTSRPAKKGKLPPGKNKKVSNAPGGQHGVVNKIYNTKRATALKPTAKCRGDGLTPTKGKTRVSFNLEHA